MSTPSTVLQAHSMLASSSGLIQGGHCLNCDSDLLGEYCHVCGQHVLEGGKLGMRSIALDFLRRHLSLEAGLTRTFIDLTLRPGVVIKDYLAGRRKRYTNPVGYLLLSGLVAQFALPVYLDAFEADMRTNSGFAGKEAEAFARVMVWLESAPVLSTVLFAMCLVPAIRVLFQGRIRTAESCVFVLYVSGHLILWQALLTPFAFAVSPTPYEAVNEWVSVAAIALIGFSGSTLFGPRPSTFLKLIVAVVGAVIAMFVLALFITVAVMVEPSVIPQR